MAGLGQLLRRRLGSRPGLLLQLLFRRSEGVAGVLDGVQLLGGCGPDRPAYSLHPGHTSFSAGTADPDGPPPRPAPAGRSRRRPACPAQCRPDRRPRCTLPPAAGTAPRSCRPDGGWAPERSWACRSRASAPLVLSSPLRQKSASETADMNFSPLRSRLRREVSSSSSPGLSLARSQLLDLVAQGIHAAGLLRLVHLQGVHLATDIRQLGVLSPDRRSAAARCGRSCPDTARCCSSSSSCWPSCWPWMFSRRLPKLPQLGHGDGAAVHPADVFAVGVDLPLQQQLLLPW